MADPDLERRFTAFYDSHHAKVYAYVAGRAGRGVADDVVSEAFLVAWRRFADVPSNELPWLLGVARNVLRARYRGELRDRSLGAELKVLSAGAFVGNIADEVTERDQVLSALATLSSGDREVLTLIAWHGLTVKEAARVVGCSAAVYSVRLHRARKRLERALAGPPATSSTVFTMEGQPAR
ncbi:MAG TPA: sigma-70 family RNA polymerase sigma factor [Streptosporangiaceae bacterium]|nr:sigma-70 family RNA polymerase sigma factor [Streptosporangiaceae bacterium]